MDFIAGEGHITAGGIQLSLLSVPDDFCYIVDAATGQGADDQMDRIRKQIWGNNQQDKKLVHHLVKLLSSRVQTDGHYNPLIVVEE